MPKPLHQADKAKLVPASTGHVITASFFLDEHAAVWASLKVLEDELEVVLAGALVLDHHALPAKLSVADLAS
jgi:hypothetical protein